MYHLHGGVIPRINPDLKVSNSVAYMYNKKIKEVINHMKNKKRPRRSVSTSSFLVGSEEDRRN